MTRYIDGSRSDSWTAILDDDAVRDRPRPPVPSKLDPYKAIIEARLAEYPKLTTTRLFKDVAMRAIRGATAR